MLSLNPVIVLTIIVCACAFAVRFWLRFWRCMNDDEPIFKTDIKITIKKPNDDESDKQI